MFLYGITKISYAVMSAIFAEENRLKNIALYIAYFILLISPEYLLPDDLKQVIIYGIWMAFSVAPTISFRNTIEKKRDWGRLLFKSNRLYNIVFLYLAVLFAICAIAFIIFRSIAIITNPQNHIQEVFEIKVDWRIFYSIVLFVMLNATSFLVAMTLNKLEIRQQGIIFLNYLIEWKDIIGYSWSGKNQDLLKIEYNSKQDKTSQCKMAVFANEKEIIENILNNKILGYEA